MSDSNFSSKRQRMMSLAKNVSYNTSEKVRRAFLWQRKKRHSIMAAAAVAFSVLCVSSSNSPSNPLLSSSTTPASGRLQFSPEQSIIAPSPSLQVTGGASTGASILKKSKFFTKTKMSSTREASRGINMKRNKPLATINALHGKEAITDVTRTTSRTLRSALDDLSKFMTGPKSDTLLLLLATALITPICKQLGTSPILGFLGAGMLLGPNGFGLISGIHTTETLAELGIVFFLFEMGIELSVERLMSMKKDVFGLGLLQFTTTALAVAAAGAAFSNLSGGALVVLGGGLALSSSAFVLQLLKDKNQLATRFGKASFGVLLFQDLAVVPLLVVTPILAGGGQGLAAALGAAMLKATLALGSIAVAGRTILNPMFKLVAQANSQEAFLGVILLTVLSMSFLTEGLGLSNTLGAFLAGVLLSETKYRYQVEADIAPFRGILLGLFFVTVGFEIDLQLIATNLPLITSLVAGIVGLKALITTLLSLAFKISLANAQQTGLILSQGGEFAFVAFGLARSLGLLDVYTTKVLLTSISLTMAITPFLTEVGGKLAKRLEENSDFDHYLGQDQEANEIKESDDFVVVVGYGIVGKLVCDLLDRKFIKYVGIEVNPNKAIQARNNGLPVFYGDIARHEVAEAFNVGKAKAAIVTISSKAEINRAVISLRRLYPDLKIFARATNADHASRLQKNLDVAAMVPILPEDNAMLTLPFGGAVLKSLGAPPEEVNAILEGKRKELMAGRLLADSEKETELVQLGVSPSEIVVATAQNKTEDTVIIESSVNNTTGIEEKTPMVAQVIQAITNDGNEPEKVIVDVKEMEEEEEEEPEPEPVPAN